MKKKAVILTMMVTTTLFKFIQSELIKQGENEIIEKDDSKFFEPYLDFLWFNDEKQFINKILKYDEDVEKIVNDLFAGNKLENEEDDKHFKKTFVNRFGNRQINKQTIEAFQMDLVSIFLMQEDFLNRLYQDLDKYVEQENNTEQQNRQSNESSNTTNNRSAFADLPQSSVNLDVDNTNMKHATDNTISKNKQKTTNESDGNTSTNYKNFQLDELLKTSGIFEQVMNLFDKKCFLQIW